ncbi:MULTISPECIES: hypothetical protein [Paenibacillus]|uniref:hypothetical protein n=1 Tax=Paenibacillus TaxID=44249 RepID=UPI00038FCB3A|nr:MULTISPECIES: hypothetical protein [Paenibacillus]CDN42009.1 hypothetical protein BN871_AT_00110 [Paenibacillus sp. P22]
MSNETCRKTTLVPTIPRGVAAAIENLHVRHGYAIIAGLALIQPSDGGSCTSDVAILRDYTKSSKEAAETLLAALVNGYEIEKTAEEAAHDRIRAVYRRKIYSTFFADPTKFSRDKGFAEGIKYTLNELGVKIEGVNA